ncbi:unnamed protein product [Paramecium pentaurelia]|uniref:TROVE domain-containing protein n=1 Tax=Paramecium pentaurelia TaxID=43138 RepID=A0A8S1SCF4_9CILI|nr:unnamed protein product [Paramecium pentaurelia]
MSFYELIEKFYDTQICKQIQDPRLLLLNIASSQILNDKKYFADQDRTRDELFQSLLQIADKDPEFVLQVAYYTRNKLQVRATSNFIIAFATSYDSCKPYCRKYFNYIVKLPTDLLEVAEYSQLLRYYLKLEWIGFQNGYLRSIPYNINCRKELNFSKMLQKCGANKFQQFTTHQLAKYCSDRRRKRIIYRFSELVDPTLFMKRYYKRAEKLKFKQKAEKKLKQKVIKKQDRQKAKQIQKQIQKKLKHTKKQRAIRSLERKFITMKDIIQMFHISQPQYNVMCILRCRYPPNQDEFKQLFPQDDIVFEQQKCGKRMKLPNIITWERELSQQKNDKVWDKLIKENRITLLASIKNLKNILSGYLSPKAFSQLQQFLSNPQIIQQNKVTMLQYYKALEALIQMKNDRAKIIYKIISNAINITTNNIPTIPGKTHIFVDVTGSMSYELGNKSLQTVAFVISQILRIKCEYMEFYIFGGEKNNEPYLRVNFTHEDLYESVQKCDMVRRQIGNYYAMIGQTIEDLLYKPKIFCDNIVIISDMAVQKCFRKDNISFEYLLNGYINEVNPKVKIFFMDINGSGISIGAKQNCHILSGASERILEYITNQYLDQIQEVISFSNTLGNQQILKIE